MKCITCNTEVSVTYNKQCESCSPLMCEFKKTGLCELPTIEECKKCTIRK